MKMKMKMKNNKMFLALVVVAALAMVSVAGVAVLSDNSSAAAEVTSGSTYTVQSDTQDIGIEIHIGLLDTTTVIIPATMTYTGTISVGNYDGSVFTATGSVNLTGVSNAKIVVKNAGTFTLQQMNATSVSGTTELTMGSVTTLDSIVDDSAYYGYNGTIICNGATIASANVYGLTVTAQNSEAVLSSTVVTSALGNQPTDWDYTEDAYYATLTVSGTAYIGDLVIGDGLADYVEMIVADGAELYSMNDVRTVGITTTTALETSGYAYAIAVGSSTAVVGTMSTNTATFVLDTSSVYNVYIYSGTSANVYTYGTIDFSASTLYTVNSTTTAVNVINSVAALGNMNVGTFTESTNTITASMKVDSDYTVTAFIILGDGTVINAAVSIDATTYVATLTFTSSEFVSGSVAKSYDVVVLAQKIGSVNVTENFVYVSTITIPNSITGPDILVATVKDASQTSSFNTITFSVNNTAKLTVDGTIAFTQPYASIKSFVSIGSSAEVNFGEDGIISVDNTAITSTTKVNATYYRTGSATLYTYNYTTLDNALAASADVTIYGTLEILADKTIESTLTGATTTKVTVSSGAKVIIGDEDTFVTVTVPSVTTLTISALNGVEVVYGKLVFEEKSTVPSCDPGVKSSVGMKEGTSYIYTDLATALDLSVSGNTVTLRGAASISTDATIISGVTVTTGSNVITINAGGSLTVTGTLKMGADIIVSAAKTGANAKAAGELIVNNMPVWTAGAVQLGGIMTISSDVGTSAVAASLSFAIDSTSIKAASPAVLNIAGIVDSTSATIGTVSKYMTVNVTGTLTTKVAFVTGAFTTMNVTGEYDYNAANFLYVLNVTGNGIVEKISGSLTINSKAVIGTAPTTSTVTTDDVAVELLLASGASAIVYGSPATGDVVIGTTATLYTATMYVNSATVYGTAYLAGAATGDVIVAVPEIVGTTFMGWYDNPSFIGTPTVNTVNAKALTAAASYYMKLTGVTYSVTFTAVQNGTWAINGNVVSGTATVAYASNYTVTFIANNGYELKDVSILLNGKAMPSNYTPTTGDVFSISGSVEEKSVGDSGLSVTEILLIVMVIIIALIAVVVILKLMRS